MNGYCIRCDEYKEIYFEDDGDDYCESCYTNSCLGYQSSSADSHGICDYCGKNRQFGNCTCV